MSFLRLGFRFLAAAGCASLLLTGCGGPARPKTVPVKGTLTYNGKPVAGARLEFLSPGQPLGSATSDEQGRFVVGTFDKADGAVVGKHKVAVTKREKIIDPAKPDDPYAAMRDLLPARYRMAETSDLSIEVASGAANDFPLDVHD